MTPKTLQLEVSTHINNGERAPSTGNQNIRALETVRVNRLVFQIKVN